MRAVLPTLLELLYLQILVFDSWIFWFNFIYTTIQFKNLCIGELLFYVEMLLRRVVIWRNVLWRNVIWQNVTLRDVTEPLY